MRRIKNILFYWPHVQLRVFRKEAEGVTAAALKAAVEPIAIKEAVYQTVPYVGIGRVKEALEGVNKALKEAGVRLPLASQTAVNDQNRFGQRH